MIISENTTPQAQPGQGWMVAILLVLIGAVTIGLTMLTANIQPPAQSTKTVAPMPAGQAQNPGVRSVTFQP
ncbi:MAG: hypothetical protein ACYC6A_08120 [Armatimonadota bacterium]